MERDPSAEEEVGESVTFEVEEGTQLMVNEDTGIMEVIDLGDPSISQEIEVVTVEATGSSGVYSTGRKLSASGSTITVNQNPVHRVKSAPALLRNSRRFQPADQFSVGGSITSDGIYGHGGGRTAAPGASHLPPVSANYVTKSGRQVPTTSQFIPTISSRFVNQADEMGQGLQHAVVLDENGQETQEYVILAPNESGEYSIVDRGQREIPEQQEYYQTQVDEKIDTSVSFQHQGQTIIICQDPDSNQVSQLIEDADGNLVPMDGSMSYQFDDTTIFSLDSDDITGFDAGRVTVSQLRIAKPKKKAKKPLQVMIGSDGRPLKKKGQTELKCMEKGCIMTCFNVSELRKHLSVSHSMTFDEETITFLSQEEFKEWRENYERERMVSFIYRGGTKKIAKDQAVTYMICHRSGHYKPTMSDESQRKRKMKPQGSCKMGGYCTAGIKLLKNLDSGHIKMEICHTHYGHPLDSDAIPHLRVNPTLRKIILEKFQEGNNVILDRALSYDGLTFTEVLAYIHHNPDRLEGLRLVDRRAVRNIFDTWKNPTRRSKKLPKDSEEIVLNMDPLLLNELNELDASVPNNAPQENETKLPTITTEQPENTSEDLPLLRKATESGAKEDEENNEEIGPPKLVRVEQTGPNKSNHLSGIDDDEDSDDSTNSEVAVVLPQIKKELVVEESVHRGSYRLRPNRKVEVYKPSPKLKKNQTKALIESDSGKPPRKNNKGVLENNKRKEVKHIKKEKDIEESQEMEPVLVSESLEKSIDKLHNHGESGPTVLLYKPFGQRTAKYGDTKLNLRRDDFCVVLQSPVQRQLMQMFPNIIGFEILDGPKSSISQLKLAFLIVLDEYREAIPIAWLVTNSVDSRIVGNFFKSIRNECGDLQSKYFMTPRNSEAYRLWCSNFTMSPRCLQNDIEVRRDLKNLVWQQFTTDKGRREAWDLMESLANERNQEQFVSLLDKIEPLLDNFSNAGLFRQQFDKDWLGKAEEWSLCHRIRSSVNVMGVSHSFGKLKKFVSFKGTKSLNDSFDHILKIGYDKCFLRSKRMFKGDQKYSQLIGEINIRHKKGRTLQQSSVVLVDDETSLVRITEDKTCEVFSVGSPCDCKLVCKYCNICMHVYICTCIEYATSQVMCEHIHLVHCHRMSISEEPELITGDLNSNDDGVSVFGRIETNGTEENPGAIINIGAVLKAAGLFHRSDGLQPDQIVSITDADTQKVLYEHVPEIPSTPEPKNVLVAGVTNAETFVDTTNMTETEIAVHSLNTGSDDLHSSVAITDTMRGNIPVEIHIEDADYVEKSTNDAEEAVEISMMYPMTTAIALTCENPSTPMNAINETDVPVENNSSEIPACSSAQVNSEAIEIKNSETTQTQESTENESCENIPNPATSEKKIESQVVELPLKIPKKKADKKCLKPEPEVVRRSNRVPKSDRVTVPTPNKSATKKTASLKIEQEPPSKRRRPEVGIVTRRASLRQKKSR